MITAEFRGGPLDGQSFDIESRFAMLEIDVSDDHVAGKRVVLFPLSISNVTAEIDAPNSGQLLVLYIGPREDRPRTRYVLGRLDERKGVAHYYVPPSP